MAVKFPLSVVLLSSSFPPPPSAALKRESVWKWWKFPLFPWKTRTEGILTYRCYRHQLCIVSLCNWHFCDSPLTHYSIVKSTWVDEYYIHGACFYHTLDSNFICPPHHFSSQDIWLQIKSHLSANGFDLWLNFQSNENWKWFEMMMEAGFELWTAKKWCLCAADSSHTTNHCKCRGSYAQDTTLCRKVQFL